MIGALQGDSAVLAAAGAVPLSAAFYAAMGLYAVASCFYFGVLVRTKPWVASVARWILVAGLVAHAGDIAIRDLDGLTPGASVREAMGALSWVLVGGFLLATLRYNIGVLGAFIGPLGLIVLGAARLSPTGTAVSDLTTLGRVHISLATLGLALFALATLAGAVYLAEARNLKNKKFSGLLFKRGVALETLDMLLYRLIAIGFPIFTVSMMLGVVWASRRDAGFSRPEYAMAAVCWIAFGGLLVGRTSRGWRGRKAALLTIGGFSAAVIVLLIYLARRAIG